MKGWSSRGLVESGPVLTNPLVTAVGPRPTPDRSQTDRGSTPDPCWVDGGSGQDRPQIAHRPTPDRSTLARHLTDPGFTPVSSVTMSPHAVAKGDDGGRDTHGEPSRAVVTSSFGSAPHKLANKFGQAASKSDQEAALRWGSHSSRSRPPAGGPPTGVWPQIVYGTFLNRRSGTKSQIWQNPGRLAALGLEPVELDRIRTHVPRCGPLATKLGHLGHTSTKDGPSSTDSGPNSTKVGPGSTTFGPIAHS